MRLTLSQRVRSPRALGCPPAGRPFGKGSDRCDLRLPVTLYYAIRHRCVKAACGWREGCVNRASLRANRVVKRAWPSIPLLISRPDAPVGRVTWHAGDHVKWLTEALAARRPPPASEALAVDTQSHDGLFAALAACAPGAVVP